MKKHLLILLTTVLFTVLFYDQYVGLNLSLFGFALLGLTLYQFPKSLKVTNFKIVVIATFLILLSNAWLFTPLTLIMSFLSLALLRVYAEYSNFKLILTTIAIPLQGAATLIRVFLPSEWLNIDTNNKNKFFSKSIVYIILPIIFIIAFAFVYITSSSLLSRLFQSFTFHANPLFFIVLILGFYLMFCFWDGWIYSEIQKLSNSMSDNFSKRLFNSNDSYTIDLQIKSGQITLVLLNIFLVIFIGIYIYEQFFQAINIANLSTDTHQRVNSLIVSVIMAMLVILFIFRNELNFTSKNKFLRTTTYVWISLNIILLMITALKTFDYISHLGLTQQRLGVLWFLILCLIGLMFTFLKVCKAKTTFYLINKMSWAFYIGLVVLTVPNWSGIITSYNLKQTRLDISYLTYTLDYNQKQLLCYYKSNIESPEYYRIYNKVQEQKRADLLSTQFYYQSIDLKKYPEPTFKVLIDTIDYSN